MKGLAALAAVALFFCGCIQPILPSSDAQRIALNACYVWGVPPAYRPFEKFFALPDGTPAFQSLRQARSLDQAQGCDVVFSIERDTGFSYVHWSAGLYAMPERRFLTRVAGSDDMNPSQLAWAVEAALEPDGDAYRKMKGLPPLSHAPSQSAPPGVSSYVRAQPQAIAQEPTARPRPKLKPVTLEQAEAELLP